MLVYLACFYQFEGSEESNDEDEYEDEDDDEEDYDDESEEEGEDWDELERKAELGTSWKLRTSSRSSCFPSADRKRGKYRDEEDGGRPPKRQRTNGGRAKGTGGGSSKSGAGSSSRKGVGEKRSRYD